MDAVVAGELAVVVVGDVQRLMQVLDVVGRGADGGSEVRPVGGRVGGGHALGKLPEQADPGPGAFALAIDEGRAVGGDGGGVVAGEVDLGEVDGVELGVVLDVDPVLARGLDAALIGDCRAVGLEEAAQGEGEVVDGAVGDVLVAKAAPGVGARGGEESEEGEEKGE